MEAGRYPFPTVVGEGGTGGEWFESVRRALRWNTRGAVQKGFQSSGKASSTGSENTAIASHVSEVDEPRIEHTRHEDEDSDDISDNGDEDEEWDIDADPIQIGGGDSSIGLSEKSTGSISPGRRRESLGLD